jgi:hypothetical protein
MLERALSTEPLVVFVHIRKTAGTTVRQIIRRQYPRDQTRMIRNYFVEPERSFDVARSLAARPPEGLRAVHGHILFWPDLPWVAGTRFFAFLRDPIERTISHYYWLRERSPHFAKSLEDALKHGRIHDNLQTRVIAGAMPFVATEETLEQALANLDRLAAIGLTERFDESLVLLTRVFGWQPMAYTPANVTANRPPREEFGPETLAVVEQYNSLDLELYRTAKARFAREVAAQPDSFAVDVAALQRAKAWLVAAPAEVQLDRIKPSVDPAAGSGRAGDLRLRDQLIDARAQLLLRDAEIERLRAGAARSPVRPDLKPMAAPLDRADALKQAAARAKRRLDTAKRKLDALAQGGAGFDPREAEALRAEIARAKSRLEGVERRRSKLG